MSLLGFGVKNLRCLTDTGIVLIKPITLLVGRNSSGKSTFLRAFPLLRQSVETPRQSPLLWYDPRYVDFGSFEDAVNYRAEKKKGITFSFVIASKGSRWIADKVMIFYVEMTIAGGPERPYVASYEILVEDHKVIMKFARDRRLVKYEVDSHDVLPKGASLVLGGDVVLLPTFSWPRQRGWLTSQRHGKSPTTPSNSTTRDSLRVVCCGISLGLQLKGFSEIGIWSQSPLARLRRCSPP